MIFPITCTDLSKQMFNQLPPSSTTSRGTTTGRWALPSIPCRRCEHLLAGSTGGARTEDNNKMRTGMWMTRYHHHRNHNHRHERLLVGWTRGARSRQNNDNDGTATITTTERDREATTTTTTMEAGKPMQTGTTGRPSTPTARQPQ
jgi:hypothetical protein